jgi:hypothetical protein
MWLERLAALSSAHERIRSVGEINRLGEGKLDLLGRDRPPLKWSNLSNGFALEEDRDTEEELQAGRDRPPSRGRLMFCRRAP